VREAWKLLAREPRARTFFIALTQSALGTGAAYVALLLIAYDRWHSPWSITLVLLADLAPAMFLGPVFGAAADRWSRKACVIVADVLRCAAFIGIAVSDSIEVTLGLALVAGCGTGLFTPAALASLPGLVSPQRLPAATSVYGAVADLGFTVGPSLAAVVLLFASPEGLILANGVTFALSAGLLARLSFGRRPARSEERHPSLFREAREGLAATGGMPGIRFLLGGSAAALLFAGAFNVAELPFAVDVLDSGDLGYSILAAFFGVGLMAGSLLGASGGPLRLLKRRYLMGMAVLGTGFVVSGLAPVLVTALGAFCLAGFGNGAMVVYERLLIQETVPDHLAGRIFGMKDALTAWAFGCAFIAAGAVVEAVGVRAFIVALGIGCILVWSVAAVALRGAFDAGARAEAGAGQLRADAVHDRLVG
jgi:MFS family permease